MMGPMSQVEPAASASGTTRPPIPEADRRNTAALRMAGRPLPLLSPTRMYVCGITPYDVTHLGHAASLVWADVAAAVARMAGSEVLTARNVTDVDDVLTRAAAEHGQRYDRFASVQEYQFGHDLAALRVREPTHAPRAARHVDHVVLLSAALLAVDAAYERDGSVVFRGGSVPGTAGVDDATARRLLGEFGGQSELDRYEGPYDVAVWQRSGPDDPAWSSPWGWGRPGWHAECAAMAVATLGSRVDVLAGGADLAFPHHAYQDAIAAAVTGVPLARAQLGVGTVGVNGAKMAKSTRNLVLVGDLLREHRPEAVRLLLVDRNWQQGWEFRPGDLDAASARLDRLHAAAARPAPVGVSDVATGQAITAALLDDLDVPRALDLAEEAGGPTARSLLQRLALD